MPINFLKTLLNEYLFYVTINSLYYVPEYNPKSNCVIYDIFLVSQCICRICSTMKWKRNRLNCTTACIFVFRVCVVVLRLSQVNNRTSTDTLVLVRLDRLYWI